MVTPAYNNALAAWQAQMLPTSTYETLYNKTQTDTTTLQNMLAANQATPGTYTSAQIQAQAVIVYNDYLQFPNAGGFANGDYFTSLTNLNTAAMQIPIASANSLLSLVQSVTSSLNTLSLAVNNGPQNVAQAWSNLTSTLNGDISTLQQDISQFQTWVNSVGFGQTDVVFDQYQAVSQLALQTAIQAGYNPNNLTANYASAQSQLSSDQSALNSNITKLNTSASKIATDFAKCQTDLTNINNFMNTTLAGSIPTATLQNLSTAINQAITSAPGYFAGLQATQLNAIESQISAVQTQFPEDNPAISAQINTLKNLDFSSLNPNVLSSISLPKLPPAGQAISAADLMRFVTLAEQVVEELTGSADISTLSLTQLRANAINLHNVLVQSEVDILTNYANSVVAADNQLYNQLLTQDMATYNSYNNALPTLNFSLQEVDNLFSESSTTTLNNMNMLATDINQTSQQVVNIINSADTEPSSVNYLNYLGQGPSGTNPPAPTPISTPPPLPTIPSSTFAQFPYNGQSYMPPLPQPPVANNDSNLATFNQKINAINALYPLESLLNSYAGDPNLWNQIFPTGQPLQPITYGSSYFSPDTFDNVFGSGYQVSLQDIINSPIILLAISQTFIQAIQTQLEQLANFTTSPQSNPTPTPQKVNLTKPGVGPSASLEETPQLTSANQVVNTLDILFQQQSTSGAILSFILKGAILGGLEGTGASIASLGSSEATVFGLSPTELQEQDLIPNPAQQADVTEANQSIQANAVANQLLNQATNLPLLQSHAVSMVSGLNQASSLSKDQLKQLIALLVILQQLISVLLAAVLISGVSTNATGEATSAAAFTAASPNSIVSALLTNPNSVPIGVAGPSFETEVENNLNGILGNQPQSTLLAALLSPQGFQALPGGVQQAQQINLSLQQAKTIPSIGNVSSSSFTENLLNATENGLPEDLQSQLRGQVALALQQAGIPTSSLVSNTSVPLGTAYSQAIAAIPNATVQSAGVNLNALPPGTQSQIMATAQQGLAALSSLSPEAQAQFAVGVGTGAITPTQASQFLASLFLFQQLPNLSTGLQVARSFDEYTHQQAVAAQDDAKRQALRRVQNTYSHFQQAIHILSLNQNYKKFMEQIVPEFLHTLENQQDFYKFAVNFLLDPAKTFLKNFSITTKDSGPPGTGPGHQLPTFIPV
jgi:hypothetical protein